MATTPAPPVKGYTRPTSEAPVMKHTKKVNPAKPGKGGKDKAKPKANERPATLIIDNQVAPNKKKTIIDRPPVKNVFPNIPIEQFSEESSSESSDEGASGEFCVNYISEFDIYNLAFNSSFRNLKSPGSRRVQAKIAVWAAEDIHRLNLASDMPNELRLLRIIDVSKYYNNRPAIRFYTSIVVRRCQIPIIRAILAAVFDKLQKESTATSTKQANWNDITVIPF